jgi:hypothetical protein
MLATSCSLTAKGYRRRRLLASEAKNPIRRVLHTLEDYPFLTPRVEAKQPTVYLGAGLLTRTTARSRSDCRQSVGAMLGCNCATIQLTTQGSLPSWSASVIPTLSPSRLTPWLRARTSNRQTNYRGQITTSRLVVTDRPDLDSFRFADKPGTIAVATALIDEQ